MNKVKVILLSFLVIFLLTSCDSMEVETKKVIDYRHNDSYTETYTATKNRYNALSGDWEFVPVTQTRFIPESYELLWEYTYTDDHTERHWEECTRFEYNNAKEELGE